MHWEAHQALRAIVIRVQRVTDRPNRRLRAGQQTRAGVGNASSRLAARAADCEAARERCLTS